MGYCSNCGTELTEGSAFCSNCGAKNESQAVQETGNGPVAPVRIPGQDAGYHAGKKLSNKTIGIIAVAVVGVLVLFLLVKFVSLFTAPAYEKPVMNYFNALEEEEFDKVLDAFPDYIADYTEDAYNNLMGMDYEDSIKTRVESKEDYFGNDLKWSYKVTDKEKLDKDDIEDIVNNIEDTYDEEADIETAYELELDVTLEGSDEEDTEEITMTVIKADSKWYIGIIDDDLMAAFKE